MPRLYADTIGTSMTEYVLAVALVALVALGGFATLGGEVELKVECVTAAIAGGVATPCGAGGLDVSAGRARAALTTTRSGSAEVGGTRSALSDEARPRTFATTRALIDDTLSAVTDALRDPSVAGDDGVVSMHDLEQHAPDVHAMLSSHPVVRDALLEGDDKFSRRDLERLRAEVASSSSGELYDLLADTASGGGERDRYVSASDARAILEDDAFDSGMRVRARDRLDYIAEHGEDAPCHGFIGCTVESAQNLGDAAVHTVMDAGVGAFEILGRLYDDPLGALFLQANNIALILAVVYPPVGVPMLMVTGSVAGTIMLMGALHEVIPGWKQRGPLIWDPNRDRGDYARGMTARSGFFVDEPAPR